MVRFRSVALAIGLLVAMGAQADVRLPALFSDHMVVQRGRPIPVWGWGTPGQAISVSLAGARGQASVGPDSTWRLELAPLSAGGPHQLVVEGDGRVVVDDVLVGEVWVGSGQSNMQWTVSAADNSEAEIAAADHPGIRLFHVPRRTAAQRQTDVDAAWQVCSPETIPGFSAVAYFFGRRLHEELDVPIGLIHSSWGGTRIEPWTDLESLRQLAPSLPEVMRTALEQDIVRAATPPSTDLLSRRQESEERLRAAEADSIDVPWAAPDADDGDWPTMDIPGQWEQGGLEGFDGMVWFRRNVDIPASWAGRDLQLHLCPVDESDVTWFDGVRVGASGSYSGGIWGLWDVPRQYTIPGRLVQPGRRVITVRAIDGGYAGGLWGGDAEDVYLTPTDGDGSQRLALAGPWRYHADVELAPAPTATPQQLPGALYHAMIHPLIRFAIRGAIWYQGESNLRDGGAYARKMEALIDGWRRLWGQPLSFYYVQLAPYRYGDPSLLPLLWEAQADVLDRVRDTGMAVITDVGNLDDIHPRDKQTVGNRLAGWALARTYGVDVDYSGPRYLVMKVEGNQARLGFEHAEGLRSADGEPLSWFEVAGADGQFVEAGATIEGSTVLVSSPMVPEPVLVRFGWHEEAQPNLVNGAGLPASPFRTRR